MITPAPDPHPDRGAPPTVLVAVSPAGVAASDRDAADVLTSRLVAHLLGVADGAVRLGRLCPRCGSSAHGRPVVTRPRGTRVHVSLARAGEVVAAAATTSGPVGVDVEPDAHATFAGFDGVALHRSERGTPVTAHAVLWCRKEAVVKAVGLGLTVAPDDVAVGPVDRTSGPVRLADGTRLWRMDLSAPQGFSAAVALVADQAFSLRWWAAPGAAGATATAPPA